MLSVFIAALVLLSGADVIAGRVEVLRLASHAFVLVGYAIVLAMCHPVLDLTPPDHHGHGWRWQRTRPAAELPDEVVPFPRRDRNQPAAHYPHREVA